MYSIIKNKICSRTTFKRKVKKIILEMREKERIKNLEQVFLSKRLFEVQQHLSENEISANCEQGFSNTKFEELQHLSNIISEHESDSENSGNNCVAVSTNFEAIPENLKKNLVLWAIQHNISNICLRDLLNILHNSHPYLPLDPRTLLQTRVSLEKIFIEVPPGRYWHFGLVRALTKVFESVQTCQTVIFLDFNIDGIPVSKSSKGQFWPILCSPDGFRVPPLVIGVYYGMAKPSSVNEFLRLFLEEAVNIDDLNIGSKKISFKIRNFICDAPARSYLKGIKGHNGYFACERCNVEGDYNYKSHQMCFPNLSKSLRTNDSFRAGIHEDHHTQPSPLEKLPIDIIMNFPLDYMHLLCLGVMKKLLVTWIKNRTLKTKFSAKNIERISKTLVSLRKYVPCDFNRTPRGLDVISFWKATEFRMFLLYLGPVVLQNETHEEVYANFMELHCAVSICLSKNKQVFVDVAQSLFKSFIYNFSSIYGAENISYNVHNLYHVVDDVKYHGPLDNISAFKYENRLQYLKRRIRSGNRPLEQIANRIIEDFENVDLIDVDENKTPMLYMKDRNKICKIKHCVGIYRAIQLQHFVLKSSLADSYFLTNSEEIVRMEFATYRHGIPVIYGSSLKQKQNFYEKPFYSKFLSVYKSNEEENLPNFYNIENISSKFFKITLPNTESVFFPLVHC